MNEDKYYYSSSDQRGQQGTGIYQLLFGRPDIPITSQVDVTGKAQETILATTLILSLTVLIGFSILKK